ncbi:hypothetical protein AAHE18_03G140700 [Arachis hypogaea]|nr:uncharacterized protein LOC112790029 isoform X2 [Arachis hypogaea]
MKRSGLYGYEWRRDRIKSKKSGALMRAIAVWTCTEEGFLKLAYTRTGKKTNLRQKSSSKFVEAARGSLLLSLVMNCLFRIYILTRSSAARRCCRCGGMRNVRTQ